MESSRSCWCAKQDADDSKAALSAVNESLSDLTDQADSDADSVKDQIDALLDQQATDKTTQQQLQATIADLNEQITTLTNQVANGATGGGEDVAALQTQLEQARQDLADVQAQLTETQDDLDEALANANTTAAPFDVEAGKVPLGGGNFSVVTNRVTCDGYADAASSCPDTFTVDGRIFSEGDGYVIEFANIARVSMGSFDGFNYGGQAPATGDVSPTCNGNPVATTFAVQIAPVRYHVDPATQAVSSTAFSFTWTMSAPAGGGCAATTRVYTGTIAL
ncbi:MAG TPA: hypothetical protein PLV68_06225 [Ilumatobacteraceae bacterium]|nr:hypothetical protein [Ilumatobacteraceae bacterium]